MHRLDPDRATAQALDAGFDLVGFAPTGPSPRADAFRLWLERGFAAGMEWMSARSEERADPARLLPGARTAIVVGLSCFAEEPPPALWDDPARGRIARYAWGPDYHDVLLPMLRTLAAALASETGAAAHFRTCVDTAPVLERDLAARAGLGFTGRNTMLINGAFGSMIFLGEILLDAELAAPVEPPAASGALSCGRCRRCLMACPAQAFAAPYVLDAGRCLSYLTIENRAGIPPDLRPALGRWVFGCDECQQVCPWVIRHSKPGRTRFLRFDADRDAPVLAEAVVLEEKAFRERYAGTPVLRARHAGFLRNAAVALGNAGDEAALPALEHARRHANPLVSSHAEWAIGRIRERTGRAT